MNAIKKWVRPLTAVSLVLAAAGVLVLVLLGKAEPVSDEQLHLMRSRALAGNRMIRMNEERQASIDKVVQIISRYNRTMSDSLKYAVAAEIYRMSQKYPNLNVDFICATITHESAKTWDPKVVSRAGALGLMQVMPMTGAFLAVEEGIPWTSAEEVLFDPILNIRLGCRYLNEMVTLYEHDGGLAAYNGGPKRAAMWIANNRDDAILWEETRNYIPAVLKLYEHFRSAATL